MKGTGRSTISCCEEDDGEVEDRAERLKHDKEALRWSVHASRGWLVGNRDGVRLVRKAVGAMLQTRSTIGEELTRRLTRWRSTAVPIVQAALAAGLSWLVAAHNRRPPCSVLRAGRCRRVPGHDALSAAASSDRVDRGGWCRGRYRRCVDLRDRYWAMANRARRGAGHVSRRLTGRRSRHHRSGCSLGHPCCDAVSARRYERGQPTGRCADRGRDWPLGRGRVPAKLVSRVAVVVTEARGVSS